MTSALVVVDMQRGLLFGEHAVPAAGAVLPVVEGLVRAARAARALVVHLQNDGPAGAVDEPHSPGWELALGRGEDEPVLRKSEDDAFRATQLGHLLAGHGADRLVVCGLLSEFCVSATARGALDRGLEVVLPHDAHATFDVPAGPGSPPVPAELASRAAEWALGDGIEILASAAELAFEPVTATASRSRRRRPAPDRSRR